MKALRRSLAIVRSLLIFLLQTKNCRPASGKWRFDWYNVKSRIEERETQREAQLVKKQGKIINGIGKCFHHIKKSTSTRKQKIIPRNLRMRVVEQNLSTKIRKCTFETVEGIGYTGTTH